MSGTSRRDFLWTGGALVVAFTLAPKLTLGQEAAAKRPGSLDGTPMLDSWIRIDADGKVTVFTGKAELGQGIKTALIQVAAEELSIDPHTVGIVTADTSRTADEGYTAGSHSMQDSGTAIRNAAAQVRAILVSRAAERLGVPPERLRTEGGAVLAEDGKRLGYGELVADNVLHREAAPQSPLKSPDAFTVMGKSLPRIDIPAKVTGGVAYVQDLRLDGMVHGRVVRPPSYGATLTDVDIGTVKAMKGVIDVVRDGDFLAVVAEREEQAVAARNKLAAVAKWREQKTLPDRARLYEAVQQLRSRDSVILERAGGAAGTRTLQARYLRPYQMHGSIGPSCAVALYAQGALTVWTHSQGVFPLRKAIAEMLGMPVESVRCIHAEGSGCYGHNAADDAGGDAALLARVFPGRRVRVQWMREDEHGWEPFGPAMIAEVRASLDDSGAIADWEYQVWSNTHSTRPGPAGALLAARHKAAKFEPPPPRPLPQPEGGGDRNAIPIYRLPAARVVHHFQPDMPLRVSALRSLGAYMNVFSIESFMDELARLAGADPVEFRLKHLDDPRARDVIAAAAEGFGWGKGDTTPPGRGRGFAFARYKNLAAYCAVAVELEVTRETGEVNLHRVTAACDCGQAVNPDGIKNQIEGGILQSASWTLYEEVTFDETRITSRDWSLYPILRFPAVPRSLDVTIIDRPGQPFLGTGEASQGPAAAAIANALAAATGARLRQLPFSPPRIRNVIGT